MVAWIAEATGATLPAIQTHELPRPFFEPPKIAGRPIPHQKPDIPDGPTASPSVVEIPGRFHDASGGKQSWWERLTDPISIFTAALVIDTFLLWDATRRLWKSAENELVELRTSITDNRTTADRQAADMAKSIAEASRSAAAMERVASSLAETAATTVETARVTREISERQAQVLPMQLRAYVSVLLGGIIPQNRETNYRYEVQMWLVNTGHTPAHAIRFASRLQIFPFPLPDDVDLTLTAGKLDAAGHVNTGQRFFFRTVLDNLISDEEINEIMRGNIRKLYVYGTVFYRDSFNEEHYTNFCQFGVWDVAGNFSTINTTRHNDAT